MYIENPKDIKIIIYRTNHNLGMVCVRDSRLITENYLVGMAHVRTAF